MQITSLNLTSIELWISTQMRLPWPEVEVVLLLPWAGGGGTTSGCSSSNAANDGA